MGCRSLWRATGRARRVAAGAAVGFAFAAGGAVYAETRIPINAGSPSSFTPPKPPTTPVEVTKCSVDDLCLYIKEGMLDVVQSVLANEGVDVNGRHTHGFTPLSVACNVASAEVVKVLLDHGADPNCADIVDPASETNPKRQPDTRYHQLSLQVPRLQDASLQRAIPLPDGMTPLHYAVLKNRTDVVALLVAKGAKVEAECRGPTKLTPGDMMRYSPLFADDPTLRATMVATLSGAEESRRQRERELRLQFPLEERLKEHIVGQLGPVHAVAAAVRRKENGWQDPTKPLVFLFLGSSGIGKTELAKQLSNYLHADSTKHGEGFIRVDMSEYQHSHEVAKFIGAPPGYVGHGEGGQLTRKLQQKPNSVVLLDEVEKAHPDVLTIMLQVFDEGRITDGQGNTIDCKDAIFVMTSNLGQTKIADEAVRLRQEAATAEASGDKAKQLTSLSPLGRRFKERTIQPVLKRAFKRDEFIGRINEILYFLPFTDKELDGLVEKELGVWKGIAKERHDIDLAWTPSLIQFLKGGYNLRYGARSIKYEIDRSCIALLAREHEANKVDSGDKITLDFAPSTNETPAPPEDQDIEGVYYNMQEGDVFLTIQKGEAKAKSKGWNLF